MDEPFGALDPQTRWEMQGMLIDISHREDNTILFVTHDVAEAVYLADTVYVLSKRPAEILHRIDVPTFSDRTHKVKASPEFRQCESSFCRCYMPSEQARHFSTRQTRRAAVCKYAFANPYNLSLLVGAGSAAL